MMWRFYPFIDYSQDHRSGKGKGKGFQGFCTWQTFYIISLWCQFLIRVLFHQSLFRQLHSFGACNCHHYFELQQNNLFVIPISRNLYFYMGLKLVQVVCFCVHIKSTSKQAPCLMGWCTFSCHFVPCQKKRKKKKFYRLNKVLEMNPLH